MRAPGNTQTAANPDPPHPLGEVIETLRTLVWPGGCAWHAVQTHASLTPFLIEETAEFIDAVERGLPAADQAAELGDVLYQVLFHAAIAERDTEGYDLAAVADALNRKLIARHPHVFGDRGYMSVEELNAEWERLKEDAAGERRGSRAPLEGIPVGMPALARAAKVVERLKRAGLLDPADPAAIRSSPAVSARPEVRQPASVVDREAAETLTAETQIGDALLALVARANAEGVDPDRALRLATERLALGAAARVEE